MSKRVSENEHAEVVTRALKNQRCDDIESIIEHRKAEDKRKAEEEQDKRVPYPEQCLSPAALSAHKDSLLATLEAKAREAVDAGKDKLVLEFFHSSSSETGTCSGLGTHPWWLAAKAWASIVRQDDNSRLQYNRTCTSSNDQIRQDSELFQMYRARIVRVLESIWDQAHSKRRSDVDCRGTTLTISLRCDICMHRGPTNLPPPIPQVDYEDWVIPGKRKHVHLTSASNGYTKKFIAEWFKTEELYVLRDKDNYVIVMTVI